LDSPAGRLVIATTVAGSAVAMLTATVVNVALPALARDLDASSGQQQWVVNGYLLTIASLILIGGNLGDRFGRLRIYRIGVAWFAVASLLCAVAPNVEVLIAARLLQGVGGALLTPGSLAIIEATLRPDDRGAGVGQWSGLGGVAGAIGPLVGGLLVDVSWRWVFLLNLPIALAVLVMSRRVPESFDRSAKDSPLDTAGAALTAVTLGGASFALIQGPAGGFQAIDWLAVAVAVVGFVLLLINERRHPRPMLPLDLFTIRPFLAANIVTLLVYGGMGVVFFLLTIQLQVSLGWRPIAAGAALLPVTGLMLVLSSRAGALARRVGPRWPLTIGPLLIALGMALFSRIGPGDSYLVDVFPAVVIFGLGLAASVAPVTATALGSIPDDRAGAASGVNNAVSRTGQLLTVAAVPPLVGLTGDALTDPVLLTAGFDDAMFVGAALVALGGLSSALLFPGTSTEPVPGPDPDDDADLGQLEPVTDHHFHCGVESPQLIKR
ncbi:MAG: MFS transporter, partial [Actinomycetota bacterium]